VARSCKRWWFCLIVSWVYIDLAGSFSWSGGLLGHAGPCVSCKLLAGAISRDPDDIVLSWLVGFIKQHITTISHFSIPFVHDNMFHPNFHDDIIQHRNKSNHPIAQGCARYFVRLTQISMSRWQGESYDQGRGEWPKGPKGCWRLLEWFPEIKSW